MVRDLAELRRGLAHLADENRIVLALPAESSTGPEVPAAADARIATVFHFADLDAYARNLYAWMAEADRLGASVMIAWLPRPDGVGIALRDRLTRAADGVFLADLG